MDKLEVSEKVLGYYKEWTNDNIDWYCDYCFISGDDNEVMMFEVNYESRDTARIFGSTIEIAQQCMRKMLEQGYDLGNPELCSEYNSILFPVECPLCGASMEHHQVGDTYIYVCPDCPAILVEWISDTDTRNLDRYIKKDFDEGDY